MANIIPGKSLSGNTNGLSMAPVQRIIVFARIFHNAFLVAVLQC